MIRLRANQRADDSERNGRVRDRIRSIRVSFGLLCILGLVGLQDMNYCNRLCRPITYV